MTLTNLIEQNQLTYSVLMLLSVMVVKASIVWFVKHEPLNLFQFYCHRLADKVNKPQNSSHQQTIAGLVAIVLTLLPLVTIIWLFEAFVEAPWLWQALLLYCAIGGFGLNRTNKMIASALQTNNNDLAKQLLSPLTLRETKQLSTLGLCKTAIEMQLIRTLQQFFVVGFIFLFVGALPALTFRLLLEMHYCWNIKSARFQHFGNRVNWLVNVLQWLPVRVFTLILLFTTLSQNSRGFWQQLRPHFFELNNTLPLHCLALALERQLGGVAMYGEVKIRRLTLNSTAKQPEAKDIIEGINRVNLVLCITAFCPLFIMLVLALAKN